MENILTLSVGSFGSLLSGVILFMLRRYFRQRDVEEQKKEAGKAAESSIMLRLINAVGKLTMANSIALRDGRSNGEMSSAMAEYESTAKELYIYLVNKS